MIQLVVVLCALAISRASAIDIESTYDMLFSKTTPVEIPHITYHLEQLKNDLNYKDATEIRGVTKKTMDRIIAAGQIDPSQCTPNQIEARQQLERQFDLRYVNLHPYLVFFNSMQANLCMRTAEKEWMTKYLSYPMDKLDAIFRFTTRPDTSFPNQKPDLGIRILDYIRDYGLMTNSQNSETAALAKQMMSICNGFVSEICDQLYDPFLKELHRYRTVRHNFGEESNFGWKRISELCQDRLKYDLNKLKSLLVQYPFKGGAKKLEIDDGSIVNGLFQEGLRDRFLRPKDPQGLLERLLETETEETLNRLQVRQLLKMSNFDKRACTRERLPYGSGDRTSYQAYNHLASYIEVRQEQQVDYCRVTVSHAAALATNQLDAYQLARLDYLRWLIQANEPSWEANLANLVDDGPFLRSALDFIYAGATIYSERKNLSFLYNLLDDICNTARGMNELLALHTTRRYNLADRFSRITLNNLMYARICRTVRSKIIVRGL